MLREFRRRLWQPPRAHGDVIEDRSVSFLELFHDLVYVVVIAAAAGTLAHDISWRTTGEFAVIFGLIFLAWINGSILHDLHGRDDVRTRTYVFAQMLLTALLAVYVGDATGESGSSFALVYGVLMLLFFWMWYSVRRQDTEEYMETTRRYLWMMAITTVLIFVSAALPNNARLSVWAAYVATSLLTAIVLGRRAPAGSLVLSDSLVERFGLFTIIVLGEVVVGVVDGLLGAERDIETIATGLFGLVVGFGFWWTYFDIVARRLPRDDGRAFPLWMITHLPLTASIAAAGAAMVTLVEHANETKAPTGATLLVTGSVAFGFLSLILIMRTLQDYDQRSVVDGAIWAGMLGGAVVALIIGFWRPAPILLVAALALLQATVWGYAVTRWMQQQVRTAPAAD